MLSHVEIVQLYFYFIFIILFKVKERPAKTKFIPTKLRIVLACSKSDSEQCYSAWSSTPRSVSHFWIFKKFKLLTPPSFFYFINISKIFRKINTWTLDSLEMESKNIF